MCLDHLRRQPPQPLVQGDVLENVSGEHLQEYRIGVPGVLNIMRSVRWNVADIVCAEVNRAGVVVREEDSHASLASNPVLPLRGVRMPMQFAQATGFERDQACGE